MIKIAEIFKSVQGEGYNVGHPCIFIRLSGCNLKCPFCDTNHSGNEMEESKVVEEVNKLRNPNLDLIIFTGGEPSLQLKSIGVITKTLMLNGYIGKFAVESNGTCPPIDFWKVGIDFVTISPKDMWNNDSIASQMKATWSSASEIKCLFDTSKDTKELYSYLNEIANEVHKSPYSNRPYLFLQPVTVHNDEGATKININATIHYITEIDPRWRISMQMQNIWKVR